MEIFFLPFLLLFTFFSSLFLHFLWFQKRSPKNLPPGRSGLPVIGESVEFLRNERKGHPENFVVHRMNKYKCQAFKTSLFGEPTVVFCGPTGNKFLFSNETKLVAVSMPISVTKLFPSTYPHSTSKEESMKLRRMLPQFLKPEALNGYVGIMDHIAQQHFSTGWDNKKQLSTYPLVKGFTLSVACRLFMSIEDPVHVARFAETINDVVTGLLSIPVNLPGTQFYKAIKAADLTRRQLRQIIKKRKLDLAENKASPTQDILSHMLLAIDEPDEHIKESEIADKILGLLLGGYDTLTSAITCTVKFLAELPKIYDQVYKEKMDIARSKAPGELLDWDDIQKMRYSWSVAQEVLRLAPPLQGAFREAITDFMYAGFSIPKGWKLYWSTHSTHKNPEYFVDPKKFDPSRFEESGPAPYTFVPFGGGPRMCPGKEYARLEILVFMHNIVKRYRWDKVFPDENIVVSFTSVPAKGLPIRLYPHKD